MVADRPPAEATAGAILAIGGAEEKYQERGILRRFVALAGGLNARIAILPTASRLPDAGQRYQTIFLDLGAASAEVVTIADRASAQRELSAAPLQHATGIFLTGGNQLRLSSLLGGSPIEAMIHARHRAGCIVAGTSAGASILARHMVAFGASGSGPRQQMAQVAAGFGLIDGAIIDQHFRERDRIGRLITLVALNPGQLGLGIDEDTAALFSPHGIMEVLGQGTVMIVDGGQMTSDIAFQPAHRAITVTDVRLHALAAGARYNLRSRQLLSLPTPPNVIRDQQLQATLAADNDRSD